MSIGQQVSFSAQGGQLLGSDSILYKAQVRTIIPAANINSQAFEIRADIDEAASKAIVAGQLTHVELQLASGESTLQVPRDAIVLRAEGKYVFRIDADNTAHKVMVSVGEGAADWVSIDGGLSAGDWVAVRGIERLQDGQSVSREDS